MHALLLSLALLAPAQTPPEGVLPVGADGKSLNLDFETGTLKDWTIDGEAFQGQPIQGDTVFPRRSDMRSLHQGRYWIGGYEKLQDKPTGTLTSVPFKVTHPWATFLVGGGPHDKETCVEIVDVAKKDVIFRAAGTESESLGKVVVDLSQLQGTEIQIRLVDKHTGHWGHLNFDDFRFHSEKPNVAPRAVTKADDYKFSGQKPEDAAKNMTVPPGFSVSLFAGEPDIHQPIAFCFDDRGRMWLVEAFVYPRRNPEKGPILADKKLGDRILILEDTDGDGKHDKKTTFLEGLNLVSGIELGFGGVWIGAAPYLLFVPDKDGDDKPDGPPQVLLDGWGYQDTHETLNSFVWGPDGYLYGCHGVFTHSRVGKPGTPDKDRIPINAGVWRYHPTRHMFEVFAHGTSNPWGLDYNQHGDFFIEACVIPHLWHMVQGGRYERQGGQHFNPYTYADIKTIAKHRHYVGATPHGGNNRSDSAGGGHAHSGLICYQGGTWPKEYHGKLFMGNIHGHRINVDVVTPKGSGYEGDRNPDFLLSNDKYCIIVAIHTGPDGNVYFCDWSDKQVCHTNQTEIWDRTNGRVFKVSHKDAKPVKNLDLQKLSDEELVKLQLSDNEWMVRHARRILQERAVGREPKASAAVRDALAEIATKHADPLKRLRGLWALHAIGQIQPQLASTCMSDKSPHMRGWIQTVLGDGKYEPVPCGTSFFMGLATEHPVVRRHILSSLIRKRDAETSEFYLGFLVKSASDTDDPNLGLMYWYAVEPLAERDPAAALKLVSESKSTALLPFMARRVGAIGTLEAFNLLVKSLSEAKSVEHQLAYLAGLQDGLKGKRRADMPAGWAAAFAKLSGSDNAQVRSQALALAVTFGDETAFTSLRGTLTDNKAALPLRQAALASLLDARDKQLPVILQQLVGEPALRSAAVRGLAAFDDPKTPAVLLAEYAKFTPAEKRDAVATLTSRAGYAKELLAAIGAKKLPATDVPAELIRQLRNLGDKALDEQIAAVWGVVRESSADRKQLIASWTKQLANSSSPPDLAHGRAVYARVCQSCHTLYGVGGKVGPDITGANRGDLDYILENMFDPSAVIPKEYAATKLDLEDGRVVTGIVKEETKQTLTVVTANETLTIPVADVMRRTPSELSMMPDDLTKQATDVEIRALVAYLRNPAQTLIQATPDNAKDFFNGKDLTGWDFDKEVWSVEDGAIVGKTKEGLKRNNFVKSQMEVADFKLTVKVKLTPNKENSGIQFRSVPIEGGEMRGPQADIGQGWWGKLYEESGRALLVKEGLEKAVKVDDWNDYVIEAKGPNVKVWINGQLSFDYTDEKLAKKGQIAFQAHSGGPMEVRFKDIKLEVPGEKK